MKLFSKKSKQDKDKLPNGFTPVPNDLIEALAKIPWLSSYEYRVLLVIIRKTYGFNKNEDWISISQISKYTKIYMSHVCRTVKKLMNKNMILRNRKLTSIQKDCKQWNSAKIDNLPQKAMLPKQVTTHLNVTQIGNLSTNEKLPKQVTSDLGVTQIGNNVTQTGNKVLPKQVDTKESIKEIDIKESKTLCLKFLSDSMPMLLAENLKKLILENKPDYIFKGEYFLERWAYEFEKMIRIDKRDPDRIKEVMEWALSNSFWYKNILSAAKLREKFDRLELDMQQKPKVERIDESIQIGKYDRLIVHAEKEG